MRRSRREAILLVVSNTLVATLTSIVAAGLGVLISQGDLPLAILTAGAVPVAVAPWMTWMTVRRLARADAGRLELESLVRTDPMTGVFNRRGFEERAQELYDAARRGMHLCAVVLDLDHFKDINDNHGHAAGDAVLKDIASRLTVTLRGTDVLARLGGEEFGAFLPRTPFKDALDVAERLRRVIEEAPVAYEGRRIFVTASVGVAVLNGSDQSYEDLLHRADTALYEAKAAGRNRVMSAPVFPAEVPRAAA